MRILFADDGVPYDGRTPVEDPLGGGERAVVGLARALAARGHRVSVATQIIDPGSVDGVGWLPLPLDDGDDTLPETVDVLVAVRRPSLLRLPVRPGRKTLWVLGDPAFMTRPAVRARLTHHRPDLLFVSESQSRAWPGTGGLATHVLTPGAAAPFLAAEPDPVSAETAVAVATVHPAHGLDWLLDRWEHGIAPAAPGARLHLYSALLTAGLEGQPVPADIAPRVERVRALAGDGAGVEVRAPQPEAALAEAFRHARVFLHPGQAGDHACWSLIDAQAAGLPAVARPLGGAAERLVDGETGHLAPDDAAFENLAAMLLTQPGVAASLAEGARTPDRRRPWEDVARELESHWFSFGR